MSRFCSCIPTASAVLLVGVLVSGCAVTGGSAESDDARPIELPPVVSVDSLAALPSLGQTLPVVLEQRPRSSLPADTLMLSPEDRRSFFLELQVEPMGSGMASYYGPGFAGRRTASGERFDPSRLTAAHRTLPFGSRVRVTNVRNNASVVVRVNDRGPYAHGRIIDVSTAAARRLGMIDSGVARVRLDLLPPE